MVTRYIVSRQQRRRPVNPFDVPLLADLMQFIGMDPSLAYELAYGGISYGGGGGGGGGGGAPDPSFANCVQNAIQTAATNVGLTEVNTFANISVQIVGTTGPNGEVYNETELNLSGGDVQGLMGQMCQLGFYSNGQCSSNNTFLVGSPHTISVGPNAGQPFTGNFRSPTLTNSVQVNTNVNTGDVQIDVDQYNPASTPILGAILHGILQVLPNMITGGDNTYGCPH